MNGRMRRLVALALVMALVAGCGGKKSSRAPAAEDSAGTRGHPAAEGPSSTDERPAELLGPAIGSRDSLVRVLAPRLREWIGFWRAADPALRLDSLRAGRWAPFAIEWDRESFSIAGITVPAESLPADQRDEQGLRALTIVAPGARLALLIDRYQSVEESENGVEIGGEPDSAPMLVERATGRTDTFEFTGTGGGYHWGAWLDSSRFVIAGWAEANSEASSMYGTLELYDLGRGLKKPYYLPAIDAAAFGRYRGAWESWVAARYHAAYGARRVPS